ncbi:hypothetical protein [Aliamphritea spongicola]|nr:hypothetical protein [Aliamphritea spongicola]
MNDKLLSFDKMKQEVNLKDEVTYQVRTEIPPVDYVLPFKYFYMIAHSLSDLLEDNFWRLFEPELVKVSAREFFPLHSRFSPFWNEEVCIDIDYNLIMKKILVVN